MQQLSKGLLFLMAATTGLVVANNYYNQPLLGLMAKSYGVTELQISSVPMLTQIGYAFGLFLIVPLGDKLKRKKLILSDFFLIIAALLCSAFAGSPLQLKIASFFIGLTSVVPQLMVPMAAQLADEKKRGAAIGAVMTGMFIGILGSRTLSGLVGEYYGWQTMYIIAAVIMMILFLFLFRHLPEINPDFKGSYGSLLKSIIVQFRTQPKLRLAGLRGALDFACFSIFWTTLVFLLEGAPFHMGSDVAGGMGLVGIAGAIMASVVGKLSDRMRKSTLIVIAILIIMASWIIIGFSSESLISLIIGAFLLDMGIQSVHITNQTIIFEGNPAARNRINTVYMVMYFTGGALGTFIGGYIWYYFKWEGISIAGFVIATLVLLTHWIGEKKIKNKTL
ncbi:MFS transporter [Robertkochia solimangrovi]|uniref:MFS transporter n=1 Tax=Robertkochia solimangrovi TaxID=2213046 RepID=UPI001180A228|nr:MFS transporter [Robertkochia solimangrovi]TRZ43987.1 MFS transporter [Robertkochia solimangrovi]